jgi:hypothetical protein
MGMLRSTLSKVAWVGKTASMVFGLALVLALIFGVASVALSASGGNFILGRANGATTTSKLTASVAGPALTLVNQSTDSAATALNLSVDAGNAPVKVNAAAGTARNLSADELDGKDASEFYAQGSKVVDSAHADQADSASSASDTDTLDGQDSTDFVSGSGSVTYIDERFSDPDGAGELKGLSNLVSVPGAQIYAACLQQSSGVELLLDKGNVSELGLWRDDGDANPTARTLAQSEQVSSPVSGVDRVIWHGSSTQGTFTAVLFTRYEGGKSCHWSGYVLHN